MFHKAYAFIVALTSWHIHCPKPHRYGIGTRCLAQGHDLIVTLLRAQSQIGYRRITQLREASNRVDELKVFLRLAHDVHALPQKQSIHLQGLLQEVGQQIGGWLKALTANTKTPSMHESASRGK